MAQGAIDNLFDSLGEQPEDTLQAYLITLLQENSPDSIELPELQEVIAGFSAGFDELAEAQQLALLQNFLRQVSSLSQLAALPAQDPDLSCVVTTVHHSAGFLSAASQAKSQRLDTCGVTADKARCLLSGHTVSTRGTAQIQNDFDEP